MEATVLMRLVFGRSLLGILHPLKKMLVEFSHGFLLDTLVLAEIGLWNVVVVDDMVELARVASLHLDPHNTEVAAVFLRIQHCVAFIDLHKINVDVFANAVLIVATCK
jgi:hypothetical protein